MRNGVTVAPEGFDEVVDDVLYHEGPYGEKGLNRNEPASVGGISYRGISQRTYTWWIEKTPDFPTRRPKKVEDISKLPQNSEKEVVYGFYGWYLGVYGHSYELPDYLWLTHVNFFTLNPKNSMISVQKLIGLIDKDCDGAWGSGTSKAAKEYFDKVESSDDNFADNDVFREHHELFSEYLLNSSAAQSNPQIKNAYRARLDEIYSKGFAKVSANDAIELPKEYEFTEEEEMDNSETELTLDFEIPEGRVDANVLREKQVAVNKAIQDLIDAVTKT